MRDAAGELSHALQPAQLVELRLERAPAVLLLGAAGLLELGVQPLALPLGVDALGHVAHGGHDEQALLGLDAREADLRRKLGTALAAAVELEPLAHRPRARLREVALHVSAVRRTEAFGYQQLEPAAEQLLAPVAEHDLGLGVYEHDPPVDPDADDRVGDELQGLLEALLRLARDRVLRHRITLGAPERSIKHP